MLRYFAAMDEQLPHRSNPYIYAAVTWAVFTATRFYAIEYVKRTRGERSAKAFISQANSRLLYAIGEFFASFVVAFFLAYASKTLALVIFFLSIIVGAVYVKPWLFPVYALRETAWRRKTYGTLGSRIEREAHGRFPNVVP